jgi:DNA-binding CsgD family transcriptional regulator
VTKEIGARLFISPHTVSRHMRNLCAALNARNRVHLLFMTHPLKDALANHPLLTVCENAIMQLILRGQNAAEIAMATGTRKATVKKHRENILDRLTAGNMSLAAIEVLQREKIP